MNIQKGLYLWTTNTRSGFRLLGLLYAVVFLSAQSAVETASPHPEPEPGYLRAFIELVRSDLRTQKAVVLAQNMDLTDDEATDFWPLQREYELKLSKLFDKRLALIKAYLASHEELTEKMAVKIAEDSLSLETKKTDLKRQYFKKFSRVIGAKKALRFFQIENQLNTAIDLRVAASLPIIK